MTDYLTDAEVDAICGGLRQNAAKVRYLGNLGYEVKRKPNGRPLVRRSPPPPTVQPDLPLGVVERRGAPQHQRVRHGPGEVMAGRPPLRRGVLRRGGDGVAHRVVVHAQRPGGRPQAAVLDRCFDEPRLRGRGPLEQSFIGDVGGAAASVHADTLRRQ